MCLENKNILSQELKIYLKYMDQNVIDLDLLSDEEEIDQI